MMSIAKLVAVIAMILGGFASDRPKIHRYFVERGLYFLDITLPPASENEKMRLKDIIMEQNVGRLDDVLISMQALARSVGETDICIPAGETWRIHGYNRGGKKSIKMVKMVDESTPDPQEVLIPIIGQSQLADTSTTIPIGHFVDYGDGDHFKFEECVCEECQ